MARIGFIGDVYPGEGMPLHVDASVASALGKVDVLIANLEGPVTRRREGAAQKGVHLRTAPERARLLNRIGVDVAVLANNHMFDYGPDGYRDTVAALREAGIACVGAGDDLAAATTPLTFEVDGASFGLLAFSAPEIETVCATSDGPGCAPLDFGILAAAVKKLVSDVDVTIVFLHWGLMGYELPTRAQLELGRRICSLGPTMVIGCHPHVVQGLLADDGRIIAYSLGDFAFHPLTADGRAVDRHRVRQTGMFLTVEVDGGSISGHEILLTRQRKLTVRWEQSRARRKAVARGVAAVSLPSDTYRRRWRRYVASRTWRRAVHRLAPWRWRSLGRGAVRGLRVALRELRRR